MSIISRGVILSGSMVSRVNSPSCRYSDWLDGPTCQLVSRVTILIGSMVQRVNSQSCCYSDWLDGPSCQ